MAMLALGIGPGDEVIVSSLTFVAGVNVVRMVGAAPVLADCASLDDWNIDPQDVERKITPRTRAVIAVHYAGYPCDMDALTEVCRRHHIALVEDSAHAIDAEYRGRQCGTFGDIGCFSFFSNKNLSVGEGGMFVSASAALCERSRHLRSHGMSTLTLDRHQGRAVTYDVLRAGLNYRIDEIRAALGLCQLKRLRGANERRAGITKEYRSRLQGLRGISVPFSRLTADVRPSYHIFPVLLDAAVDRAHVIQVLRDCGVQSSIHYPSVRTFSAYRGHPLGETPVSDDISTRELTLPLYPTMEPRDIDTVVEAMAKALR
jgi:dTDP-4-amino-4,6-dideoxygalactose transaminase